MGLLLEYTIMLLIVLFWILLGSLRPAASAVVPETTTVGNVSTMIPLKTVPEIEKEIEALVGSISKMTLPYLVRNSDLKLSPSCMSTFFKIFVDIRKLKMPIVKLLDAMAKPPFGIMEGTFIVMGDYDECLEVSSSKKGDVPMTKEEEYYHGQYCTIEASLPPKLDEAVLDYGRGKLNLSFFGKLAPFVKEFPVNFRNLVKFRIGVCLPSTCTEEDLTEILGLNPLSFIPVSVSRCEDGQKKPLNADQMVFFVVIALFAVLVLSGTALDAWFHIKYSTYKGDHKDKFVKLLLAFSVYSNTKKLMTPSKKSGGEIPVVNGMYVMGTVLVIIYHTYFLPFLTTFSSHVTNIGTYLDDFFFTLIAVMGISIEAYFLFSGMFLVYPRFRRGEETVKVNMIKLIVRRYLRLGPSMLIILGIIVILPVFGSGPVWVDIFDTAADNTRKWWYTYALMYNNFLEVKDQNFLYLWFIPCLMQISIVGAILLWVMGKNVKVGMCLTVATGLACNIALGVLTALRHYPAAYAIYYYYDREYFEETIYTAPLSHVFSYGIGMILGYFMAKNPTLKWSKVHVIVGWIVSLFLTVGVQFIAYVWHEGREPDPIAAAIYAATHRTAFSLGLSWIILACTHGYGGVFGKILCWKGFGSLSKLGYFGYLIHYIVITYHVSVARSPLVFSHYEILMRIAGYTLLTFIAAYILYITFELPLVYIESLFLPSRRPNPAVENNNMQQNGKSNDISIVRYNGDVLPPNIAKPVWNGNTPTPPTYIENDSSVEHSKL